MIILRTIAQNPDLAFLASVIVVAIIAVLRSFVGIGYDIPRSEPNVGDE